MIASFKKFKKINESKLVEAERYDKDDQGRGIIDVGAEKYEDIFSYYDLDGENVLDWEFVDFVEKKADAIPQKEELALHFHVKDATKEKEEEVKRAVGNHYIREIKASYRTLQKNSKTCVYLLIMGLIAFGIYIPLTLLNVFFVVPYIFDLVAWVFLWEVVDNFFIRRASIKMQIVKQARFVGATIKLVEYKDKKQINNINKLK